MALASLLSLLPKVMFTYKLIRQNACQAMPVAKETQAINTMLLIEVREPHN